MGQVRDVINGKLVHGEQKEIQEVKNAYAAYERFSEMQPFSIKSIKLFHGDECIFMAPPAQFVPQLMEDLFMWMKKEKDNVHPLIMSSVFHYELIIYRINDRFRKGR